MVTWAVVMLLMGSQPGGTVEDFTSLLDEPTFFEMLGDMMRAGDEAGVTDPADLDAIHNAPAHHRGRWYLIEGKLLRVQHPPRFSQRGPWERTWRQWVVRWGANPQDVAVVYVVAPPEAPTNARVSMRCRFYKIWRDTDQLGEQTDYPVFIARGAAASPATERIWRGVAGVLLAVVAALIVYMVARRGVAVTKTGNPRSVRRQREPASSIDDPAGPSLPDDPSEAMAELARRGRGNR